MVRVLNRQEIKVGRDKMVDCKNVPMYTENDESGYAINMHSCHLAIRYRIRNMTVALSSDLLISFFRLTHHFAPKNQRKAAI